MFHFPGTVATADNIPAHSKLGKLRGVTLPVEYDLERYIQNLDKIDPTWNITTPACEWNGVNCDASNGLISSFDWGDRGMSGTPMWEYLPSSITYIRLAFNSLSGPVPFGDLPRNMTVLNVTQNMFSGELDFGALPTTMKNLFLSRNEFSGLVDSSTFPESLTLLYVSNNVNLYGEIRMNGLPKFDMKYSGTKLVVK
mmetsp:Transcript_28375/g.39330  ORF Transcript_28375/g.39330 Transcript_28375/m.39330 type:complete len:197 (-) Transcript_28375:307-897(-)